MTEHQKILDFLVEHSACERGMQRAFLSETWAELWRCLLPSTHHDGKPWKNGDPEQQLRMDRNWLCVRLFDYDYVSLQTIYKARLPLADDSSRQAHLPLEIRIELKRRDLL